MSNFELCFQHIIAVEGGYSNRSSDLGGATKWGITARTLSAHRGYQVTPAEVKAMAQGEAKTIYERSYWRQMKLDGLSLALSCTLFDIGVNRGPVTAIMIFQRLLKVEVDGDFGPKTRNAAIKWDEKRLLWEYLQEVLRGYINIAQRNVTQVDNLEGWTNRVLNLMDAFVVP